MRAALVALGLMAYSCAWAQRLPIRSFSASAGLPGGGIAQISKDAHGFLWFCGTEGIARFDGQTFTRFGSEVGWPPQAVHDFLQTRDGTYWIATSQGLFRLDPMPSQGGPIPPGRKVHQVQSERLAANCLLEDRAGVLWCGTSNGLFRVVCSPGSGSLQPVDLGLPQKTTDDPVVTALAEKEDGGLWIGAGSGLYTLKPDGSVRHFTTVDGLPSAPSIRSLALVKGGMLWVATVTGVGKFRLLPGTSHLEKVAWYSTANGLGSSDAQVLLPSGEERIFVGTATGLSVIESGTVRNYGLDQGVDSPVLSLAEGARGELWLGTDHGVQRWDQKGLTTYSSKDQSTLRVDSILEDRIGTLVTVRAGKDSFYLQRLVGDRMLVDRLRMPPGIHKPGWGWHQPLLQDHLGAWWCATDGGLCRFDISPSAAGLPRARHRRTYKVEQISGSGSDEVFAVFEDSRGDVWFSNSANPINGLGRWVRAEDRIEGFNGKGGIPSNLPALPTAFTEDHAGNVWVAFNQGGIARYRNGHFDFLGEAQGIPECWIRSMMVDTSGRLWLACGAGGVRIVEDPAAEAPRIRALTMEQGLAGNSIWSCVEDRWGRVYVGTGAGVDQVDLEHGRVLHLSESQGMAPGVPRAAFRDREGALWFGLSGGLSRYLPPAPVPEQPPPIYLIGLRVAGETRYLPESGTSDWEVPDLPPQQNRIQVDFTGPGVPNSEALRYQYRLEGVSEDWSPPGAVRSVDFANLASGHYHFLVRAVGSGGTASQPPAELRFTVLRPWWMRWWFLSLASASLLGLGWLAYRYRLRQLLEVERIRTRIAADLHDDIGASLSRISILSEVVKSRLAEGQTETASFLTEIAESSRDLVDSMSEIVWSIDPRRDNLKHLLARVGQFANGVLAAKGIRWTMNIPDEPARIRLTPEQRRGTYLILKEAINNAMKHSRCHTVHLQVEVGNGLLTAQIQDDGSGLPPEPATLESSASRRPGRGLLNMHLRAKETGGRLKITSGAEGTTIRLEFPHRWSGGA